MFYKYRRGLHQELSISLSISENKKQSADIIYSLVSSTTKLFAHFTENPLTIIHMRLDLCHLHLVWQVNVVYLKSNVSKIEEKRTMEKPEYDRQRFNQVNEDSTSLGAVHK